MRIQCPVCNEMLKASDYILVSRHLIRCGVIVDLGEGRPWQCLCGFLTDHHDNLNAHFDCNSLNHDWPTLLTAKLLKEF